MSVSQLLTVASLHWRMVYFASPLCFPDLLFYDYDCRCLPVSIRPLAASNFSLLFGGGPLVCLFKIGGAENLTLCFLKIDGIILSPT
jgi:hypothetical protein